MSRSFVAVMLLVTAVAAVVAGTRLRDRSREQELKLLVDTALFRSDIEHLEKQRTDIAQRPSPFLGCPNAQASQPAVACYECIGLLKNVVIETDEDTEKLGEIDGRIWECRRAATVERRIATERQNLAGAEIELGEAHRRYTRGNLIIGGGFALALIALVRALLRK
jgi:hypothetical protein